MRDLILDRHSFDAPDINAEAIGLGVALGALVLGNIAVCFVLKRRKRSPPPPPPVGLVRDPNVDAELGRLQ